MLDSSKRKAGPGDRDNRESKRSKGGSGGKWQTPHQKAKVGNNRGGRKIEPGDVGIWATCVKGKEGAATQELMAMFDEYAVRFYSVVPAAAAEDEEDDIESSIRKELDAMANKQGPPKLFTPVYLDLQCVLFFKTVPPVVPVDFVHRICEDARSHLQKQKMRFVNRLTPMTMMAKASEKGLEDVCKAVLGDHFHLGLKEENEGRDSPKKHSSYAIRPTIRNNNTFTRDIVIKLVASLISSKHKVDLTKPDKVIIVEVYQTTCGVSVVGDDWEGLKRYNLAEIYQPTLKPGAEISSKLDAKAMPNSVTRDESKAEAEGAHLASQ